MTSTVGAVPFEYLGKSGKFLSGLNGQPTSSAGTTLYSPQYVVGGTTYRTTLSVVNLESTSGTVTFKFIKDDGTQIGATKQMPISAKGKISIARAYLPSVAGQVRRSGYIKVKSDKGVATFALFGTNSLSALSAVPPQVVP